MSRTQRIVVKVVSIIELVASAVCSGVLPSQAAQIMDESLAPISEVLGFDYVKGREEAFSKCMQQATAPAERQQAEASPETIPASALIRDGGLRLDYDQAVLPWIFEQLFAQAMARSDELNLKIEHLQTLPEGWTGTRKSYDETIDSQRRALRDEQLAWSKMATRMKNGTPEASDKQAITDLQQKTIAENGRTLTAEQTASRLRVLLQEIFTEEAQSEQFYPTPEHIIKEHITPRLHALAATTPQARILEPSAGSGMLATTIVETIAGARLDVIELSPVRAEYLMLKGFNVVARDYLNYGVSSFDARGRAQLDSSVEHAYDAVVMNPPYAKGIGQEHVRRAVMMVKPQGIVIAIIPDSYVNGTSQGDTAFQGWLSKHGRWSSVTIYADDFNKTAERRILINLAVVTMTVNDFVEKSSAQVTKEAAQVSHDLKSKWAERVDIPQAGTAIDHDFRPPQTITARRLATKPATIDIVDPSLRKHEFIKPEIFEGVNKAVEGLDKNGGFLLADGTGVGKTLQQLIVARHYWLQEHKPVLIFTVSDRVIQGSFFGDAQKLGWKTPDRIDTASGKDLPKKPRNYKGLYDDVSTPSVYLAQQDKPLRNGINIATYNTLSNWTGLESTQSTLDLADGLYREQLRIYKSHINALREELDQKYPKVNGKRTKPRGTEGISAEFERRRKALWDEDIDEHPAAAQLQQAREAHDMAIAKAMAAFAKDAPVIIFDEAHSIKNAGDGLDADSQSNRARLALTLVNNAKRVMYTTATPTDRPQDVLYLKKLGFWRDDAEYRMGMRAIGYEWQAPKKNTKGDLVQPGRWKMNGKMDPFEFKRANAEMQRIFYLATEEGAMLRRELELTNLTVTMHKFNAPESALALMEKIVDHYTDYVNGRQVTDWMAAYSVMLQELESYKIEKALELIDAAVKRGRQVVVFVATTYTGDDTRMATGSAKSGATETLARILSQRYGDDKVGVLIGTENDYENYRRLENVDNFQKGKLRVLIGTITSGGTGINLDDTTGKNPREMVIVTAPLSFINVMQAIGRVVRAKTASRSYAHFIFSENTDVDRWLSRILATKFATLAATVEGESSRLDPAQMASAEEGDEASATSLIVPTARVAEAETKRRHPLLVKTNRRWEGWTMPNNVPLYVEVSGTPKNTLLSVGGRSRDDLTTFLTTHKDLIEELSLKPNPVESYRRYNGSYLGALYSDRSSERFTTTLEQLLNVIDARVKSIASVGKPFDIGDRVTTLEAIDFANVAIATLGTITNVRPPMIEGDSYRYDLKTDDGREVKSILGYVLSKPAEARPSPVAVKVGDQWYYKYGTSGRERFLSVTVSGVTPNEIAIERRMWLKTPSYELNHHPDEDRAKVEHDTIDVLEFDELKKYAFQRRDTYGYRERWELLSQKPYGARHEMPAVADDAQMHDDMMPVLS
ncbi:MAG: strawberry notch family protein [Ignavibacteria bacterium]|nr:strawberry notch family protein [Ignavibacteria bacterium]